MCRQLKGGGMEIIMKKRKKNPYRSSFLAVAIICCIAFGVVFYGISFMNSKVMREQQAQEKAQMCMEELETQLQILKEIAINILSDYKFRPSYFQKDISKELSMLKLLEKYKYYSTLSDEYFIDYGGDLFFISTGKKSNLETFLRKKTESEEERQRFLDELAELRDGMTRICEDPEVLHIFERIVVLIPFRLDDNNVQNRVILGFVVENSALEKRFQIVSGEMRGGVTLYGEEGVLYSNREQHVTAEQKGVITQVSADGKYSICFLPQKEYSFQTSLFFLQILLILIDAVLVLIVTDIFAKKTYEPIWILAKDYSGKMLEENGSCDNAVEELKFMMDRMLQSNIETGLQVQENQKILRDQVLKMIVSGNVSWDLSYYMEKAQIYLPGALYCVISISFEEEAGVTEEFISDLRKELEQVSDENKTEISYVICDMGSKLLDVICSVHSEEMKVEFVEMICEVANSFDYKPKIGIGNFYKEVERLCASWLESRAEIQGMKGKDEKEGQNGFEYHAEDVQSIVAALESGNEELALERLKRFVEELGKMPVSMLMMQYILADFLGEIRKMCDRYQIELSKQNVSLLVSIKNVHEFEQAVIKVIHDFDKRYEEKKSQMMEIDAKRICEYIEEHFTEYEISIESVATYFHVNADIVRQAVLLRTGKMYRDYLIYLRIEYAKVLLRQEDISVSELCQKIGYGNVSYFIKLFRESTGVTPAKYRKMF